MNNLVEFMGNSGLWMAFLGSAIAAGRQAADLQ